MDGMAIAYSIKLSKSLTHEDCLPMYTELRDLNFEAIAILLWEIPIYYVYEMTMLELQYCLVRLSFEYIRLKLYH